MKKRSLSFLLALAIILPLAARGAEAPSWPSLGQQLRADAVIPHSALEGLIAANQDFSVLRPEEAKDQIRVPLWLRVLWRHAHPEMVYSASDPTGGYPLVLKEVHEWMTTHQDLRAGPPTKDVLPELDEDAPTRTAGISLEQKISGSPGAPRSESDIRVNYWDPTKIIAASNNISGTGTQAQFFSTNGGTTWGQSSLSLQPGDAFHSDPTVDWTSDGTAWSTTIGINSRRLGAHDARLQVDRQRRHLDLRRHVLRRPDEHRQADHVGRPQRDVGVQGQHLRHLAQRPAGVHEPAHRPGRLLADADPGERRGVDRHGDRRRRQDQRQRRRVRLLADDDQPQDLRGQVDQRRRLLRHARPDRLDLRQLRHRRAVLQQPPDPHLHLRRRLPHRHQEPGLRHLDRPHRRRGLHRGRPTSRVPTRRPPARPASGSPAPPTAAPPGRRR